MATAPVSEVHITPDIPDGTLEALYQGFLDHGDIYQATLAGDTQPVFVISKPDWAQHVLAKNYTNYKKGLGIERVRLLLGNGLMASEGELWKFQRQMMQPFFQQAALKPYESLIQECASDCAKRWQGFLDRDKPINLTKEMSEITLHFILKAIFSEDLSKIEQAHGENPFEIVTDESARNLEFARNFRRLAGLVREIIQQRVDDNHYPDDIISRMLKAKHKQTGESMPLKNVLNETMTLIVAGHETTAASLNWTWWLISQHPKVAQKLYDEVSQLAGANPTLQDITEKLDYTRQVIEEAMRLYPAGWLLTRKALGDDEIAGVKIPAGAQVFISPYILHRHPDIWEAPEQFDPERFTEDKIANRHRYAYIPFSAGARNCIGDKLGMAEMLGHIGYLAQLFKMQWIKDHEITLEPRVNLRPKYPIMMKLSKWNAS